VARLCRPVNATHPARFIITMHVFFTDFRPLSTHLESNCFHRQAKRTANAFPAVLHTELTPQLFLLAQNSILVTTFPCEDDENTSTTATNPATVYEVACDLTFLDHERYHQKRPHQDPRT